MCWHSDACDASIIHTIILMQNELTAHVKGGEKKTTLSKAGIFEVRWPHEDVCEADMSTMSRILSLGKDSTRDILVTRKLRQSNS